MGVSWDGDMHGSMPPCPLGSPQVVLTHFLPYKYLGIMIPIIVCARSLARASTIAGVHHRLRPPSLASTIAAVLSNTLQFGAYRRRRRHCSHRA